MQQDVWQFLLSLENRDTIARWFQKIHSREINARRAKEIMASAKQAREYFRNSDRSDNSVRPLLTFYGVAGISRALTLLLRRTGGEESLARSHGLEAVSWGPHLSGEITVSLGALPDLRIRTCACLFMDFAAQTKNRLSIHVRSSAVDWRL
jgi:hypothetical protein